MQLELDDGDAAALSFALESRLGELARELSRTEQHTLQHELAQLVSRLEVIASRLRALRTDQTPLMASAR